MGRPAVARQNTNFYHIIGDSSDWANYFTPKEYQEMTDVAERLRAPMDHTIAFEERSGKLYCDSSVEGDDLLTISKNAEFAARQMTKTDPAWSVEALRRSIETQEIIQAIDLPFGAQMVVFSPTPDAVLAGAINIGGYNLDKKTTMVRVWTHDETGISCRYISLDGGNREALTASARAIGWEIPVEYGSEEILSTFCTFSSNQLDLAGCLIDGYDAEMKRQTGRNHSYGRLGLNHKKALEIAYENPAILHEHMAEIKALKWQYSGAELDKKLEDARYNYAAALDQITRGEVVTSNTAAGGVARASGVNFAGYCAPNSTQEAYGRMFSNGTIVRCVNCPHCKQTVDAEIKGRKYICPRAACPSNRHVQEKAKQTADSESEEAIAESTEVEQQKQDRQKFGAEILSLIKKFIWGPGAFDGVEQAIDYHGRVIATGQDAKELYNIKHNLVNSRDNIVSIGDVNLSEMKRAT
jgi:ssDNA-binding Zn-finger/Zn-ribbon topoisomerase 1